jgi:hypothetical protein
MGAGLGSNPSANVALGALDWSMGMGAPQQQQQQQYQQQQQQQQHGGMGGFGGGGAVNPFASPQAVPGGGGAFSQDPFAAPQQQQQAKPASQGLSFNPFE